MTKCQNSIAICHTFIKLSFFYIDFCKINRLMVVIKMIAVITNSKTLFKKFEIFIEKWANRIF